MWEFQELKVFAAIVDSGGFQRASKKLFLTQSAVSQSLANLERKLGEKLVERTSPVRPTAIGLELLHHTRYVLERENEFLSDLRKLKQGRLQKLSVTVDFLVNEYFLHIYIKNTLKALPEMSFKTKRLPAREMIQAVKSGQFELGVGAFQKNMDALKLYKLFDETSYLVTGKQNKKLGLYKGNSMGFIKETVLLASFLDEPALRPSKTKIRDYFKEAWEIDNIAMQVKLLDQGIGATYLPKTILDRDPLAKNFIILNEIPFFKVSKPYGIYHREKERLSEAADFFIKEAQKL